jgi:hypothetical protein
MAALRFVLAHNLTVMVRLRICGHPLAATTRRCPDQAGIFPALNDISIGKTGLIMTLKMRLVVMWMFTGALSALMLLSALPDLLQHPEAAAVFHRLGYPAYLLPFLGTAKILGVLVVVAPGVVRLKEWAFAGLTFDLLGALYSHLAIGDPPGVWMPALIGLVLISGAYASLHFARERLAVVPQW